VSVATDRLSSSIVRIFVLLAARSSE
jgi:hypothetical protein